jgi:acyl dehydratase
MAGRYFGQWAIGDRVEHALHRTVTETDNLLFSSLTLNGSYPFYDADATARPEPGRLPVASCFTFGLLVSVAGNDTTLGTMRANLSFDNVVSPNPVFVGDTLHAESEVTDLRASRSHAGAGIVIFQHRMLNQRGLIVCQCLRVAMVDREPA